MAACLSKNNVVEAVLATAGPQLRARRVKLPPDQKEVSKTIPPTSRTNATATSLARSPYAKKFLAVPLFWKILLGNLVVAGLGIVAGSWLTRGASGGLLLLPVVEVITAVILGAGLVNAALIHLALRPLESLEDAAMHVSEGDLSIRVPETALADPDLRRLSRTFNHMLETLEEAQRHQQESSKQLIRSGEQERRRVSRGLYSDVAQRLAGVLVRLQTDLDQPFSGTPGGTAGLAHEIRAALDGVRRMARHLHPPELDELGVYAALAAHARSVTEQTAMEVSLIGDIPELRLSADARLELFRIVEELTANAARLDASKVTVHFHSSESALVTNVTDDGTGAGSGRGSGEMGRHSDYLTLYERARHIGGTFQIESGRGRGMHFRLVIPWQTTETERMASA